MNYFFVTGDSSGIGKALKEHILQYSNNFVYGISRSPRENRENYRPLNIDLASSQQLESFNFPVLENAEKIILVNNAGQIGSIQPVFNQTAEEISAVFQLNTIAPAILISKLIQSYPSKETIIINISSGAASSPIQGWATYCASKAGLEMLTKTVLLDLEYKGLNNIKVYSVSPGVIDTGMQVQIRNSNKEDFQMLEKFQGLKKNEELVSPKTTAGLIYKIFEAPSYFNNSFINLREHY